MLAVDHLARYIYSNPFFLACSNGSVYFCNFSSIGVWKYPEVRSSAVKCLGLFFANLSSACLTLTLNTHETLDRSAKKKPEHFTALDLTSGYFQTPI